MRSLELIFPIEEKALTNEGWINVLFIRLKSNFFMENRGFTKYISHSFTNLGSGPHVGLAKHLITLHYDAIVITSQHH